MNPVYNLPNFGGTFLGIAHLFQRGAPLHRIFERQVLNTFEKSKRKNQLPTKEISPLKINKGGLPTELWFLIFSFLDKVELSTASAVCRDFFEIARSSPFNCYQSLAKEQMTYLAAEHVKKRSERVAIKIKNLLDDHPVDQKNDLQKLIAFPSVRKWILSTLPNLPEEEFHLQGVILTLLRSLLLEGNPWAEIVPLNRSDLATHSYLRNYLNCVYRELQKTFDQMDLKEASVVKALKLGASFPQGMDQEKIDAFLSTCCLFDYPHLIFDLIQVSRITHHRLDLLIWSIGKGYKALVDLLTNEKHYVHLKDRQGRSLLEVAVKNKREAIIILLLTKGADPDERPSWLLNGSLARIAVENRHLNILKLLLHRSMVNQRIPLSKETLLHRAARNGSVEIAQYLCEIGAKINIRSKLEETALSIAIYEKHEKVVAFLLQKNACYSSADFKKAAKDSGLAIFKLLWEMECRRKHRSRFRKVSREALLEAAMVGGQVETVAFLKAQNVTLSKP